MKLTTSHTSKKGHQSTRHSGGLAFACCLTHVAARHQGCIFDSHFLNFMLHFFGLYCFLI